MAAESIKSSQAISCVSRLKITNISGVVSVSIISVTMGTEVAPETSVIFNQLTLVDRPRRFYQGSDVYRDNAVIQELPKMDGCLHDTGKALSNNKRTMQVTLVICCFVLVSLGLSFSYVEPW
jgi:hypothetical protein